MNEEQLIAKLLKVLEENILPLTKIEVKRGNKIFGAAILKKSDLNLVVAGTNQETHNPLWHGEISCLNSYWALPKNKRVPTKDCIFFSTHEPCSLCLSAITSLPLSKVRFGVRVFQPIIIPIYMECYLYFSQSSLSFMN